MNPTSYVPPTDTPLQRIERDLTILKWLVFVNLCLSFAALLMEWSR